MVDAKAILTYPLALAIAATQVLGVGVAIHGSADANGDRQVDVRDVQAVVTQVLRGLPPDRRADVNNDGRIDVLDLQRVLAGAAEAEAPRDDRPQETRPKATVPAGAHLPAPALLAERHQTVPSAGLEHPASYWSTLNRAAVIPADTERYLFRLTPHAPPVCAA